MRDREYDQHRLQELEKNQAHYLQQREKRLLDQRKDSEAETIQKVNKTISGNVSSASSISSISSNNSLGGSGFNGRGKGLIRIGYNKSYPLNPVNRAENGSNKTKVEHGRRRRSKSLGHRSKENKPKEIKGWSMQRNPGSTNNEASPGGSIQKTQDVIEPNRTGHRQLKGRQLQSTGNIAGAGRTHQIRRKRKSVPELRPSSEPDIKLFSENADEKRKNQDQEQGEDVEQEQEKDEQEEEKDDQEQELKVKEDERKLPVYKDKETSNQEEEVNGSSERIDLKECKSCGRKFMKDRLEKHQSICNKNTKSKRKVFDVRKARIEGTDAAQFGVPKGAKVVKKKDWRIQREEFVRTMKDAKRAQQYVKNGGDIRDLPPPPPAENLDYIECPHCGRKFSASAADRHIPKCAEILSNKKKPINQSPPKIQISKPKHGNMKTRKPISK